MIAGNMGGQLYLYKVIMWWVLRRRVLHLIRFCFTVKGHGGISPYHTFVCTFFSTSICVVPERQVTF